MAFVRIDRHPLPVTLESADKSGDDRHLARHFGQRSLAAWERTERKRFPVALLAVGLVLGASQLLSSAAVSRSAATKPAMPLVHDETSLPMVQLLDEMKKVGQSEALAQPQQASFIAGAISRPLLYQGAGPDRDRAISCLATAAWYEAGNDVSGERAVMQVVLNRLRHPSFPKSVCGVVFQGSERTTGCQFSFTCDGSMSRRFPHPKAWRQARMLAEEALDGAVDPDVRQATHFHADYVSPWWASKLVRISQIGAHIFYGWRGERGAIGSGANLTYHERMPKPALAEAAIIDGGDPEEGAPNTLVTAHDAATMQTAASGIAPTQVAGPTVLKVDTGVPNGSWALAALNSCAGKTKCRVIGYGLADQVERNRQTAASAMDRPLFLYVRDASGMEVALWDCDRTPRANAAQCLPHGAELSALL